MGTLDTPTSSWHSTVSDVQDHYWYTQTIHIFKHHAFFAHRLFCIKRSISWVKGSTINDLGGRRKKSKMNLFFPRECLLNNAPTNFLRPHPQIINGRRLKWGFWKKGMGQGQFIIGDYNASSICIWQASSYMYWLQSFTPLYCRHLQHTHTAGWPVHCRTHAGPCWEESPAHDPV